MTLHEQIVQAFNNYITESEAFDSKGVKLVFEQYN